MQKIKYLKQQINFSITSFDRETATLNDFFVFAKNRDRITQSMTDEEIEQAFKEWTNFNDN